MKRARKSNRVSWAPGPNLCQVKLFYSNDCPSNVGKKSQDHHQGNKSMVTDEYDDLPPGFEGSGFQNQSKLELSCIPQIKWKSPPLFAISDHWCVASGEESKEKGVEELRTMGVLEAMYPRTSSIPPSPYVSNEVKKECYDDGLTIIIPTEDLEPDVALREHENTPTKEQLQNLQHTPLATSPTNSECSTSTIVPSCAFGNPILGTYNSLVADVISVSTVVAAAIVKNCEELFNTLNDSTMLEKIINEYKVAIATTNASSSTVSSPNFDSKLATLDKPATPPIPLVDPISSNGIQEPNQSTITSSVTMPTPHMHMQVNKNIPLVPNGGLHSLDSQSTQQNTVVSSTLEFDHNKHARPPVSLFTSTLDHKPPTPSVPFPKPISSQLAATSSVTMPTPHMHMPINNDKKIPLVPNGVLHPFKSPQQTRVMSYEVKQTAPLPSAPSTELNTRQVHHHLGARTTTSVKKDVNYYRNLVKNHGTHDEKGKLKKQCKFFKTSNGCRNGSNCSYQHDRSA